jgi:hypothetical protein
MIDRSGRARLWVRTAYEFAALAMVSLVAGQVFTLGTDAACPSWLYECALGWRLLHVIGSAFFFSSFVAVLILPLALREWSKSLGQESNPLARPKLVRLRFWIYCNMAVVLLVHLTLYTVGSKFAGG